MIPIFAQAQPNGFADFIDRVARTPLSKVVIFVAICTVIRMVLHPMLMKTPAHKRDGGYIFARFSNEMLDAIIYAGVFVFLLVRPFGVQTFRIPSESMVKTLLVNDFLVINKAVYRYSDPKAGDIVVFRPPTYACTADQIDTDGQPKVDFIKRCVGGPGDTIEIRQGILFRNGKAIDESAFRTGSNQLDFKIVKYDGGYTPWKGRYIPVLYRGEDYNYNLGGIAIEFGVGLNPDNSSGAPWVGDYGFKPVNSLTPEETERMQYLRDAKPAQIPAGYYLMCGDNREFSFDGRAWGLVPRSDIVGRAEVIWWPSSRWRRTPSLSLDPVGSSKAGQSSSN